jgi:probable HAF family extracellular repeat protein
MNRNFTHPLGSALCVLLLLVATDSRPCGQNSGLITALPTLGGSQLQLNALNASGQITGVSLLSGDQGLHAFLYSGGVMTDLDPLGGTLAINASGQVAGEAVDSTGSELHAFVYSNGILTDLGTLGGPYSTAIAINDAGQVAGYSFNGAGALESFLYADGSLTGLGSLGGSYSAAVAINQSGSIAGNSYTDFDSELHAYLYANGEMTDLLTLGGGYSWAYGLNDSDMVAGESTRLDGANRGFIYSGGTMTEIGTLGGSYSSASAINNAGQVIGLASTANDAEFHAFIYSGGSLTDLGTLGGGYSTAKAINNLGQVVGESTDANGESHAFIWRDASLVDLNSFLPENSGWVLNSAQLINDAGRIVGYGTYSNNFQAFILDLGSDNHSPVAVAGPDQDVGCQAQVTLDGSASSDPDGDTLSYEWSENGTVLGTTATLTATFDLGTHTFTLTVTDPCGASSQDDVVVHITDTTAPTISCPGDITIATDAHCQAVVPNLVSQIVASDNCTPAGSLTLVQNPPAGTSVGLGTYTITVTATDASGNSTSCSTVLTVVDTTAPVISSSPPPVTIPVDANCQATVPDVTGGLVASDNCTAAANLLVSQNPAVGTPVGRGQYSITVTVADASGNSTATSVSLSVVDTIAPVIVSAPSALTVAADANCEGAVPEVVSAILASDNCTPANELVVTQNPAAGTLLPKGQYLITVTVSDASGNRTTRDIALTIADLTKPTITAISASPDVLSPPNNWLIPVTVSVTATDNCDPAPVSQIISITANDTVAAGDIQITGALTANLAASKNSNGTDRIYTITVRCTDASGNSSTATVTVTVPKNNDNSDGKTKP